MKNYKASILCVIVIVIVLVIGFLTRNNHVVYNCGDTYYVLDYFTISKFASFLIAFLGLVLFFVKIFSRKKV